MQRILNWIKMNKVPAILVLIILFLLFFKANRQPKPVPFMETQVSRGMPAFEAPAVGSAGFAAPDVMMKRNIAYDGGESMTTGVSNRMVMQESSISLLVNNVEETKNQILSETTRFGGFMVNIFVNNPADAATATITVRIPSSQLSAALQAFKGMAVKVVSENLQGTDVTDQYTDIEAQMATLTKTKAKFEEILDKATEVQDILTVQREIISLQMQMDSLKGQQEYLEKSVETARLSIYLSTDELALPYEPSESWRPQLIFKEAVRSMIMNIRKLGSLIIWLAVYAVIWLPVLGIIYFLKRRRVRSTI